MSTKWSILVGGLLALAFVGGVVQGQTERFELEGNLKFFGSGNGVIFPDGTEKLIADVPNYDFNWQINYELANPIEVPVGTKYHIHAVWDNSDKNPNNPDSSQKVVYGAWTDNEMLTTWSHVVLTDEILGLKVKDGRVVGHYDDAQVKPQPQVLQSFPATFTRPRTPKKKNDSD